MPAGSVFPGHIVIPMRPWPSPGVTAATRSGLDSLVLAVGMRSSVRTFSGGTPKQYTVGATFTTDADTPKVIGACRGTARDGSGAVPVQERLNEGPERRGPCPNPVLQAGSLQIRHAMVDLPGSAGTILHLSLYLWHSTP